MSPSSPHPELLTQVRSDDHYFFASRHALPCSYCTRTPRNFARRPLREAEALGQADALELAGGADGDLVDEDDGAGNLEGREVLAAEVADG